METVELKASLREEKGGRHSKRLRKNDIIPGIVYGRQSTPLSVKVKRGELEHALHTSAGENVVINLSFEGKKNGLMRVIKYQDRGFAAMPEEEPLLTGIEDIEVLYSYEDEDPDLPPIWLNIWEQEEKVPLGVKIRLKLKGLGNLRDFTKTIFIPVGSLGSQEEESLGL